MSYPTLSNGFHTQWRDESQTEERRQSLGRRHHGPAALLGGALRCCWRMLLMVAGLIAQLFVTGVGVAVAVLAVPVLIFAPLLLLGGLVECMTSLLNVLGLT